jgi:uncharacterized protein YjiK
LGAQENRRAGRKPAPLAAIAATLLFSGCATPGPLHVYSLGAVGATEISDRGESGTTATPSFVGSDEKVTGFAYDPFTDHFFLRLEPGYRIRVVDRPARAIKREFSIEDALPKSGGDLAVRPRDGHLFLLDPDAVMETTRLGKLVRTFTLTGVQGTPGAIAFDMLRERLLVLGADGRNLTVHDLNGARIGAARLATAAGPSLAFDAQKRELYAFLQSRPGEVGVFDEAGRLLRTIPAAGPLVDVGQRSLIRVF